MFRKLKESGRLELTGLLFFMSVFCFTLSIARIFLSGRFTFFFMNWNLFLAFIPWAVTSLVALHSEYRNNKGVLFLLLFLWLIFFPNSPYILTDLLHLKEREGSPLWFDLILILSFSWTGLLFGFQSLMDIKTLLSQSLPKAIVNGMVVVVLFTASFGVYIGRYLRWNSWDIIGSPVSVLDDVGSHAVNPISHPRTWGMTILLGILLNFIFWGVRLMRNGRSI
jgi:uncharacterized membrane protein